MESLPSWLADMVRAVTEQGLIPVDLAFGAALGALSAATGRVFRAESLDGFRAPLGLYLGLVGDSAEGKSKALGPFRDLLEEAERETQSLWAKGAPERNAKLTIEKGKKSRIEAELKRKPGADEAAVLKALTAIEQEIEALEDSPPQNLVNDVTMEELAFRLSKTRHLSSLSSEGGIFTIAAGLYNKGAANIDVILHAYDVESYVVNRRMAPPIRLEAPSLTLCIGIQPSKLADLASNKEFLGRGLLNRFLYIFPLSKIGTKNFFDSRPIPHAVKARYRAAMNGLLEFRSRLQSDAVMPLSPEAHLRYTHWRNDTDKRAAGSLADVKGWACKLMDTALRLAGLLHVADHAESISQGITAEIPLATMEQAIQMIDGYFIPHGRRAWFNGMVDNDAQRKAVDLLRWAGRRESFQARDVLSSLRKTFPNAAELVAALDVLLSRNLILEQSTAYSGKGRRPAPTFKVHPEILGTLSSSQQKQQNAAETPQSPYPSASASNGTDTAEWTAQYSRNASATAESPPIPPRIVAPQAPIHRGFENPEARDEASSEVEKSQYSRMDGATAEISFPPNKVVDGLRRRTEPAAPPPVDPAPSGASFMLGLEVEEHEPDIEQSTGEDWR